MSQAECPNVSTEFGQSFGFEQYLKMLRFCKDIGNLPVVDLADRAVGLAVRHWLPNPDIDREIAVAALVAVLDSEVAAFELHPAEVGNDKT